MADNLLGHWIDAYGDVGAKHAIVVPFDNPLGATMVDNNWLDIRSFALE